MFQPITVIFDSSVLYPAPTRDIIIELSCTGLYQAKWTEKIHEEWISNLLANREDLTKEKLLRTKELMNNAVPDCIVKNYEELIEIDELPDPNDRHVVAAAIKSNSQLIVTYNLKDFPSDILKTFDIEAVSPDDFFLDQLKLQPHIFLHAIKEIRNRLKNPSKSPEEYLFILQQARLYKTVDVLEKYAQLI